MISPQDSTWKVILFSLYTLAHIATFAVAVRALWLGHVSTQVLSAAKYMLKLLTSWRWVQDDDLHKLLHRHLLEPKVRNLRFMMQLGFFSFLPIPGWTMFTILEGRERLAFFETDLAIIGFLIVLICPVLRPTVVSSKTMDLFYGLLMVLCTVCSHTVPPAGTLLSINATNMLCLVLTWVRRVGSGWGSLFFVVLNFAYAMSTSCMMAWRIGNAFYAISQFAAVTSITMAAFVLERGYEDSMLQCLEYQEAREMLAAASALLNSCCEVVVELDATGVILSEATDLSSFLLKGPFSSLKGTKLVDLLVDPNEREQFSDRLAEPKLRDIGLAENMPVSMLDACGTRLRLELMWFQFRRLDGRQQYKVGIREFADCPVTHLRAQNQQPTHAPAPAEARPNPADVSPQLSEATSVTSGSLYDPDPTVFLDSTTPELSVLHVNAEFAARVGRLPVDACLRRYLTRPAEFVCWLQHESNEILNGHIEDSERTSCSITLRMPQGKIRASCRIAAFEEYDIERVPVRLHRVRLMSGPGGLDLDTVVQRHHPFRGTPTPPLPLPVPQRTQVTL